jgi:hypothetical protein
MNHDEVLAALGTATGWRKSTRSQAQNACIEVTEAVPGWVGVRDTKLGSASPLLAVSAGGWAALVTSAKDGEFDR